MAESGASRPETAPQSRFPASAPQAAVVACGAIGALLLLVAEFTALYETRTSASDVVKTVGTGSNHTYALIPIALLAAFFLFGVWKEGSRPALLAVGVLGVVALLIALLNDLPDVNASGLVRFNGAHPALASNTPSAGFYMETLGAVMLILTSVSGFLLLAPPPRRPARAAKPADGEKSAS